jgi:hypothetical protein
MKIDNVYHKQHFQALKYENVQVRKKSEIRTHTLQLRPIVN